MAAKVQGQGGPHLYGIQGGIGVIQDATVISFSLDSSHKNVGVMLDEVGNEQEWRFDDLQHEGTITLTPKDDFTPLVVGDAYSYNTKPFVVMSEGRQEEQQGFVVLTYAIKKGQYIAPS